MQESFPEALVFTLQYEGGYVDNPRDPGGPTNLGITIATLSHELGHQATRADVRNLTKAQASAIYRKKYWNAIGADGLPKGVDLIAFDIAVNMGVGRALQFLTITGNQQPVARIARLDDLRLGYWRHLSFFATFWRGWKARETACKAAALKLAGG